MKRKLIPIFALLILVGCQPIMKKMYGIKNPDVESERTIIKKALKYKLDTSNIVSVHSKYFLDVLNGQGIPDGAVYDRNGNYIEYRKADTSCNAGLFQFIPSLNVSDKYSQPDSSNLDAELKKFRDLKGNTLAPRESADFYVLIYWTVWTGKLNKDHVKIWENLARQNQNCNIKVMKVNLDLQEYWDEQEREKIIHALPKKE